jgi:hypothetical protein
MDERECRTQTPKCLQRGATKKRQLTWLPTPTLAIGVEGWMKHELKIQVQ